MGKVFQGKKRKSVRESTKGYSTSMTKKPYTNKIPRTQLYPPKSFGAYGGGGTSVRPSHEIKCVDIPKANYPLDLAVATNANVYLLNGIQEGTGEWNRIGRKVFMKSLYMNGNIYDTGFINNVADYVRIMIVYDRSPNGGALPAFDIMFQDTTQAGGDSTDTYSNLNIDYKDRFTVLRDWRMCLPATNLATVESTAQVLTGEEGRIQMYVPLNLETIYNSTANPCTNANINTGSLYLVLQGTVAAGSQGFNLSVSFRLRYDDNAA